MNIRTVLHVLFRSLGDLLLRYFVVFVICQVYFAMITLGNLEGVIPGFYLGMGTYRLDLMLPLLFVHVPIWWVFVALLSIWKKSWWIEVVVGLMIVALLWWILPAVFKAYSEPVMIWGKLFEPNDHERLAHYIRSTTTFMLTSISSLVIVGLKNWRGIYDHHK